MKFAILKHQDIYLPLAIRDTLSLFFARNDYFIRLCRCPAKAQIKLMQNEPIKASGAADFMIKISL
jgi:hypothetical protein